MADSVNIQNLLQAGYFTTSRSRSKSPNQEEVDQCPDPRRLVQPRDDYDYDSRYDRQRRSPSPIRLPPPPSLTRPAAASRSKPVPPRPTVDDEDSILDKEHGYTKTVLPEEEAASKGDADQAQTIMEVHEFNPERRFVLLDDESATSTDGDRSDSVEEKVDPRPKSTENSKAAARSGDANQHSPRSRSAGLSPPPPPPPTGRRRSRQDLPVLETELSDRQYTEHHRSRSAVNGPRPDYFNPSQSSRAYGDQLLSPDFTKHSSRGRDDGYYGREHRDRSREKRRSRISPENSARRSDTASEYRAPRRTSSIDRDSDRRNRGFCSSASREAAYSRPVQPPLRETPKLSARTSREPSRSKDEYPKTSQPLPASRMPLIVQEDSPVNLPRASEPERGSAANPSAKSSTVPPEKIPPRTNTMPAYPVEKPPVLRPAATINLARESQNAVQSPLPYPEEDAFPVDPFSLPRDASHPTNGPLSNIHMPALPLDFTAETPARQRPANANGFQSSSPAHDSKEWKLGSFDPERDGVKVDRPVGAFRRYSENKAEGASDRLPNCPRTKPVAGRVDWLTLPRTDFNICPECYGQVFYNSDYRTHFQPVLRPTMDAIVCDFGSSPWYRIAWLLILKNNDTDLRVFHDIAAIASASRGYLCPGDRKTTREWYTIRDPYTKRPVPKFTVCYQCAKTVEALLPRLSGIFVPLDSRSSPVRSNCALHFEPDRTEFVFYFDSFETTADKAEKSNKGPDLGYLAQKLERLCAHTACREDKPITDGYWHFMQFLPELTVCADCFEDVVQPQLSEENVIARNFYIKPRKVPLATCQLYSPRMRDAFKRACRRNDHKYLESKVKERLEVESSIKSKLAKLDRDGPRDARKEKQIDALIEEWKEWE
ncbi:hypothetical protein CCM_01373 [Cordyceps militaris CM01]|uniref:Uncharacterized protein n=1 Tax=Cordyceps militaris (strain CM01) TaxID=983644 RepID=G3J4Q0_CORMM|nr:uncharacterized protein CCM_01373 [Cordyceps militaris CM01]EGX96715.1 hypothetical protein CCM_01373 [Cordyceps militaris CM01]